MKWYHDIRANIMLSHHDIIKLTGPHGPRLRYCDASRPARKIENHGGTPTMKIEEGWPPTQRHDAEMLRCEPARQDPAVGMIISRWDIMIIMMLYCVMTS